MNPSQPNKEAWREEIRTGAPWTQDGTKMLSRIEEIVARERDLAYANGRADEAEQREKEDAKIRDVAVREVVEAIVVKLTKSKATCVSELGGVGYLQKANVLRIVRSFLPKDS